ncbi:MAG: hypothetical protein IJ770_05455 [Alphaproteobacteria bacterium]|nr:hypothetical protein [Alphaproteobacteria bacterium]
MDIWDDNTASALGYRSGGGKIDSYGVDHSGFSVRDELEYQRARMERENLLMQNFNQMGITDNYPQYGAGFWGGSAENNYGFGTSNIGGNIENVTNQLNNSGFDGGLNQYQQALNAYAQAKAKGSFMSGSTGGWDSTLGTVGATGGFNNGANNGQVFANSDYTVNTESLVGQPSSYFQNNNNYDSTFGGNTNGLNSNTTNLNNATNGGFNQSTNFGTKPSFAIVPNSAATPAIQNQTPTPWSYNEPQTTPTPWSTTTATPTPWNNGATYPQQMITPTPWSNPASQINPVPWRNNQTITSWAGGYDLSAPTQSNSNYISDEDLYARMWENIKEQEGVIPHPYLDTKGLITIGGGANVNDWNVFKNLNVTVNGVPATEAQKREAYNRMRQLSEEKDINGNYVNRNTAAENFAPYTNIRISDAEARGLAQNHMNNDLAHVRGEFSDFDSFPLPLKEVLLDIQYNTGNLNQQNWPNLYNAIQNRNINGIVSNVHRKDVQQERNDWAERMARSIRF